MDSNFLGIVFFLPAETKLGQARPWPPGATHFLAVVGWPGHAHGPASLGLKHLVSFRVFYQRHGDIHGTRRGGALDVGKLPWVTPSADSYARQDDLRLHPCKQRWRVGCYGCPRDLDLMVWVVHERTKRAQLCTRTHLPPARPPPHGWGRHNSQKNTQNRASPQSPRRLNAGCRTSTGRWVGGRWQRRSRPRQELPFGLKCI